MSRPLSDGTPRNLLAVQCAAGLGWLHKTLDADIFAAVVVPEGFRKHHADAMVESTVGTAEDRHHSARAAQSQRNDSNAEACSAVIGVRRPPGDDERRQGAAGSSEADGGARIFLRDSRGGRWAGKRILGIRRDSDLQKR